MTLAQADGAFAVEVGARPGAHLTDAEAQLVHAEVLRLPPEERTGENLVRLARQPGSPLARVVIPYGPEEAARRHYAEHARKLLRSIEIRYLAPNGEVTERRPAFYALTLAPTEGQPQPAQKRYVIYREVAERAEYIDQVLARVRRDAATFRERAARYRELLASNDPDLHALYLEADRILGEGK